MSRVSWSPGSLAKAKLGVERFGARATAATMGVSVDALRCALKRNRITPEAGWRQAKGNEPLLAECVSKGSGSDTSALAHSAERPIVNRQAAGSNPAGGPLSGPSVHTSRSRPESFLVISDLQIPYHHPAALDFCKQVRFEFGIPLGNVLCVGDEFDLYAFSRFEKSPDAPHTPSAEIAACKEEIARWGAAFPKLRICKSNHGGRLAATARRGMLPNEVIRPYREVFGVPEGWQYADHWIVDGSRERFRVEHGHRKPGGHAGLRTRPLFRGLSTAWGHEHAEAATLHVETGEKSVWGLRVGSLITREPVPAFDYNADDASRPVGSVGVVLDGGRLPLVVKM